MGSTWIDYETVKSAVPIGDVLAARRLPFTERDDGSLQATCPIHQGHNPRQFRVTANGRGFHCFGSGCRANGNVIDFVAALDDLPFRDAAIRLAKQHEVFSALRQPGAPAGTRKPKMPRKKRARSKR